MKILHVLDTSVPVISGYTSRAYYLIQNQKKLGVTPVSLTSERFFSENDSIENLEGVTYYRSRKRKELIRKVPFLAELDEIKCLKKRIAEVVALEKPDIVHSHSPSLTGAACLPVCRRNNIPLIYEIRAFWEDAAVDRGAFPEGSLKYRLRRMHETNVVNNADAVIVICNGLKGDLVKRGIQSEKIHIVQNGVDYEQFKPLQVNQSLRRKYNFEDKLVIGFIGSFFNFEGLQDLVSAMTQIIAEQPKAVLMLVGKGQVEKELQTLVHAKKLEHNVYFTGRVPHKEIDGYYSIIDLLVYPRIKKRITDLVTPLKPLEAMAMEKAVLMSNVGGLTELADAPNVAAFYEAGNIDDLARKCLDLLADQERKITLGVNARKNIVENWGWDKRAELDLELYKMVLNGRVTVKGQRE